MDDNIRLKNEDLDEVLGKTPLNVLKLGIVIPLVVLVVIFLGACFYHYPDVITADATVTVDKDTTNCVLYVQAAGSGKIKCGQRVILKIDNFPDMEYGCLRGVVDSVCGMPNDAGFYLVFVDLPYGVITNTGKNLSSIQLMKGRAEIILDDKYLVDVFIEPLKNIYYSRLSY